MAKRRPALHPDQLALDLFEPAPAARHEGDLAGLEKMAAAGVARALKEDRRSRFEVAGAMSALLDDEVSKFMLDAYASEARGGHNISFARAVALFAATERWDILDALLQRAGARVLVGEEVLTARVGHLRAQKAEIERQLREAERLARPISRGGDRR